MRRGQCPAFIRFQSFTDEKKNFLALVVFRSRGSAGGEFMPTSSSSIGMEGDALESLRTFLRGMRDSCYQYLGIAAQIKVDDDNVADAGAVGVLEDTHAREHA